MNRTAPLITNVDRMRLGTMLERSEDPGGEDRLHIHALAMELDEARVVNPAEVPPDLVTMNSTVRIRDLESNEEEVYTITYPYRADSELSRISVLAPIGRALFGRRAGETVVVQVPSGSRQIRIEEVEYQPERAGVFDL